MRDRRRDRSGASTCHALAPRLRRALPLWSAPWDRYPNGPRPAATGQSRQPSDSPGGARARGPLQARAVGPGRGQQAAGRPNHERALLCSVSPGRHEVPGARLVSFRLSPTWRLADRQTCANSGLSNTRPFRQLVQYHASPSGNLAPPGSIARSAAVIASRLRPDVGTSGTRGAVGAPSTHRARRRQAAGQWRIQTSGY